MNDKVTLKRILKNLDVIITCTTLSICVVVVNINVLLRYFFHSPSTWSEEVVTSLFVWTVFIGSAYAYRMHAHLGVDIVVNLLPGKIKTVVADVMAVIELLVLIMLTVISAQYVYHLIFSRTGAIELVLTDMLRMPKWWTGIAVPIGFGLSTFHSVKFMLMKLGFIKTPVTEEGGVEA